jgi:hypothetical protein
MDRRLCVFLPVLILLVISMAAKRAGAQKEQPKIDEINNEFHFLGPEDRLLIHEENGKIKGSVDVLPGEEESDAIFTYFITIGTREKDHVQFKTSKIHQKYYRFSGTVTRGSGSTDDKPDYLRLVGELQIITVNGMTGEESAERKQVVFKSLGADEIED